MRRIPITPAAVVLALAAAGLIVGGVLAAPKPARADGVQLLVCPGSETAAFDPPLTQTSKDTGITVGETFGPCIGTALDITNGTISYQTPAAGASCEVLLGLNRGLATIAWNTGQTSTIDFGRTTENVAGVLVSTLNGNITAGAFKGNRVEEVVIAPLPNVVACQTDDGLANLSAVVALTVLPGSLPVGG